MRILALLFALALTTSARAADLLVRASSQATGALGLFQIGVKPTSSAIFQTPYLQGTFPSSGTEFFVVLASGGTGHLLTQTGTTTNAFGATVPVYGNYDTGFWMTIRWNGPLSAWVPNAQLVVYDVSGLAVVASGAAAGTPSAPATQINDTFNTTAQTPTQPPAAVLLTAPAIL